ncbi:hypothetical protein HV560_05625 [Mannheimia pernigra]|uniref:ESPR domain-containing protein n=1 Tax=Mannheimia pernigra TaxID=111844 RepID=A0ABD7A7V2_9PAST|nr:MULTISPECIES: ESPR domain-containing protein [Mannheimia]QLB42322.1 hypothetical protein HV560_05625 [Mannheimia pernigra]QTM00444.1 hypothetical protein GM698_01805 [Mannheimia sp. ZY171111]
MNNIHQVIFNKSTQQFVVVSELAKSAGKPKAVSAGSVDIVSILQNFSEKRPLVDFSLSTIDQKYRHLIDAGVTFAQKFNLRPGITLSPSQVAKLTTDIVWFENQSVRLPNGKVETVLVPKVYAMAKKGDITGNATLLVIVQFLATFQRHNHI